jgi:Ion channel
VRPARPRPWIGGQPSSDGSPPIRNSTVGAQTAGARRPVRSRVAARRASHSYGYVLLLIAVSFVFGATAPDAAWAASTLVLLQSATLVVALWTSGLARAGSWGSIGLLVIAVATATAGLIWGGTTLTAFVGILSGLLTCGIALVIAGSVVSQGEVNTQSITGAICVYLLFGMIFVFVYGVVAALGDSAFFLQGTDGTRSLRLYFSFVTLATLGYGDYTPATELGHALAVIEALLGQVYLVTVVALLVARIGRRRRGERGDSS